MIKMNVIYISNEDLLYKFFCRISKLLISQQWYSVFFLNEKVLSFPEPFPIKTKL